MRKSKFCGRRILALALSAAVMFAQTGVYVRAAEETGQRRTLLPLVIQRKSVNQIPPMIRAKPRTLLMLRIKQKIQIPQVLRMKMGKLIPILGEKRMVSGRRKMKTERAKQKGHPRKKDCRRMSRKTRWRMHPRLVRMQIWRRYGRVKHR